MMSIDAVTVAVMAGAATIGALAVGRTLERRTLRDRDRVWREAHPLGRDGIVPGAEAITLEGAGTRAVLLLHGFGDTPQSLSRLAAALHAEGWTVCAPLLPGHGRTLAAFGQTGARDWGSAARTAYEALVATHARVALVGLSMGGALATGIAADGPPPSALVLLAPYLHVSRKARLLTGAWRLWSLWRPWVPGNPAASILDPVARHASLGYGGATPRLLRELRRVIEGAAAATPRITAPTLAIFSTHDYRIPTAVARASFDRLGARDKALQWVERSGHVVTVDRDADAVIKRVVDWLERHEILARARDDDGRPTAGT